MSDHIKKLSVYSIDDGESHCVAYDEDDAIAVMALHEGITVERYREDYDNPTVKALPAAAVLRIKDEDSDVVTAKTAAEWVQSEGRGFLCSVNF